MVANRRLHYALLVGLGVLVHGLLLLNDGIYWDDWYLHIALSQHQWRAVAFLADRGVPTDPWFWWIVGYGGKVFLFKLVKFLSILLTSILLYEVCFATRRVPPGQALAIAALALTYPGDETPVILTTTNYYFYYVLFWLAVLLAMRSEEADRSPRSRLLLLCSSVVLFLLSFNLNSLLVFYFGFLLMLFLSRPQPRRIAARHAVFLLLPFLFWCARLFLFPQRGYFVDYNRIDFHPSSLIPALSRFAYYAGVVQMNAVLRQISRLPLITAIVLVLSWYFFGKLRLEERPFGFDRATALRRWIFGVVLLLLSVLPYAAVGKAPTAAHGTNTRYELLLGVPVACLIVWSLILLLDVTRGFTRPAFLTLTVVLTAFSLQTVSTYLAWQAEYARERALVFSLAQHREGNRFSTLWLCDDVFAARPYFITGIDALLLQAWGANSRISLDPTWPRLELRHPTRVFVLPGETPQQVIDPQGTLAICGVRTLGDFELSTKYILARLFAPQRLQSLYPQLVRVQFYPVPLSDARRTSSTCCR